MTIQKQSQKRSQLKEIAIQEKKIGLITKSS